MLKKLFFASAVLFFFAVYFHNIIEFDQDLGRHLISGQIIWQTHEVPRINLFSYTYPQYPFINTHWFSEVVFYLLSQGWGIVSLVYFKTAVMVAALCLTLYTAYKFSQNLAATAIAFALFAPVLLERTEIRPEIFSYLFISLFVYLLFTNLTPSNKPPKILFVLPLAEIVWVNTHIYFILGPILVSIFLIQQLVTNYLTAKNFRATILITKYYLLITCLVWLATLINPNGFFGAIYPLRVFDNYGYSIVENQNIFFLNSAIFNPNIFYFEVAVIAFLISFLLTDPRKLAPIRYLLAALVILSIIHIRSFPLLFLILLPVFAHNLAQINEKKDHPLSKSAVILFVIGLTFLRSYRLMSNQHYLSLDSHKRFGTQITESGKGAADFVLENRLHGPIFNNFDIGSYLDYRLFPGEKVFVDGRPEAYPKEFFQNLYIPMQMTAENFTTVDKISKFNLIIFSHTDVTPWAEAFLKNIIQNKTYAPVYLDGYAAVFVKKETFPEIVEKFSLSQSSLAEKVTSGQWPTTNDYQKFLSLGRAANLFGYPQLTQKFFEQAYALNPDSPGALQDLGQIYSQSSTTLSLGQQYLTRYRQKSGLLLF